MISVAVLLLGLGATARITRFVNQDVLFAGVRDWAVLQTRDEDGQLHPEHKLPWLLTCPWCASIWIAGGVFSVAYFYGHTAAYWITCAALSASYVYAVSAQWLDPPESDD